MNHHVTITDIRPCGPYDTVVCFEGQLGDGTAVVVAIDHRPARDVARALIDGPVEVECEPWQLLSCTPWGGHSNVPSPSE